MLAKRITSIALVIGLCFLIQTLTGNFLDEYKQRLVALAGLYVTLAVSLNLINGITGQFSIGHAAFYQVGAYTAGYLTFHFIAMQGLSGLWWMVIMAIAGAIVASIAGLLVGLPSLRLKGDYLAIVTLGFGEIIRILVQNMESLGGSYGMNVYPSGYPKAQYIALIWLLAFTCIAVFRNLLKTAHGLAFLSVRDDEMASQAMGVNITRVKVAAFVLASAFAGAAGGMLALYEGFITPGTFTMDVSFIILTMVMLGGAGSITGSTIAAITLFYIPEWLREQPDISGAALIAAIFTVLIILSFILRIRERDMADKIKRYAYLGSAASAIVVHFILTRLLSNIPQIAKLSYEGNQLRMVIFAGTLIILMLLKPQGLFAGFEISWEWIRKILRINHKTEAAKS